MQLYTGRHNRVVSESNPLPVYNVGHDGDGGILKGAVLDVPNAGTRVQLPNQKCKEVTVIAKRTNTGSIFVGGDDVSKENYGVELLANDSFTFVVPNANLIWIDASVSGEGITYVVV